MQVRVYRIECVESVSERDSEIASKQASNIASKSRRWQIVVRRASGLWRRGLLVQERLAVDRGTTWHRSAYRSHVTILMIGEEASSKCHREWHVDTKVAGSRVD